MAGTGIQSFAKLHAQIVRRMLQTAGEFVLDLWHSTLKHTAECQSPLSNERWNANSVVKFARGMPQAERHRS
jgi:hypothetical protein